MSDELPRWSFRDVHDSMSARSFIDALERIGADDDRLVASFDEHDVRAVEPRPVTVTDGIVADTIIGACNDALRGAAELRAYVYAMVTTNSRDELAPSVLSEIDAVGAGYDDLLSRAGMETAEELGRAFGLDVTSEELWTASLDVLRARITEYERLAIEIGTGR